MYCDFTAVSGQVDVCVLGEDEAGLVSECCLDGVKRRLLDSSLFEFGTGLSNVIKMRTRSSWNLRKKFAIFMNSVTLSLFWAWNNP